MHGYLSNIAMLIRGLFYAALPTSRKLDTFPTSQCCSEVFFEADLPASGKRALADIFTTSQYCIECCPKLITLLVKLALKRMNI